MKEERFLISVIIPIYNVSEYLHQCLRSVCGQTYGDIQIILVDDGSTDDSLAICREVAENDARVQVISKKNGGLVSARKEGVKYALGKYVSFVDGDDWIDSDMYERLLEEAEKHSFPDIVAFGHVEEHESFFNKVGNNYEEGFKNVRLGDLFAEECMMTEVFFQWKILPNLCNKLIVRSILSQELESVSEKIVFGEDAACTYPCIRAASSFLNIKYFPYHYRQRKGSIVKSGKEQSYDNFSEIYKRLKGIIVYRQLHQYLFFILLLKGYSKIQNAQVLFPFAEVKAGSRIFVYGAGAFGKVLYEYIRGHSELWLAGWTDKDYLRYRERSYNVDRYEKIFSSNFDYIIIAILNEEICRNVEENFIIRGISQKKILYISHTLIEKQKLPDWLIE